MTTVNEQIFAHLPEAEQTDLLARAALKRNGHGPVASTAVGESNMPSLPANAQLDPSLGVEACPWLDDYAAYSRLVSPRAYDPFHEAVGIWLLSTIAAGRLVLRLGQKVFKPSLYIALVAHTTLHAKTTTARIGQEVLREAGIAHLLLPNDTTPQAMVSRMMVRLDYGYSEMTPEQQAAERQRLLFPAQKGWFYDEFGSKVAAMMRENGPMADFRGLLRVLDDHLPEYDYVTLTRHDRVERPYLALLAGMTPVDIRRFAGRDAPLWGDGFWPRFAFVTPPIDEPAGFGRFPAEPVDILSAIIQPLRAWHARLGLPRVEVVAESAEEGKPALRYQVRRQDVQPTDCLLGTGVWDAFYAYHDGLVLLAQEQVMAGNSDLSGNYGRFAEKAMRIAMLLASVGGSDRIELRHWARAQTITERWRECLHNLADQVAVPAASEESQRQDQIVRVLQRRGPLTASKIKDFVRGLGTTEVQRICEQLEKVGVLVITRTTGKGTKEYAIATD